MAWYVISGRNVAWTAAQYPHIPTEHFKYPQYPAQPTIFSILPFLEEFGFNLPTGVNPLAVLGAAHPVGLPEGIIPSQQFYISFLLQQGYPMALADALIANSQWEGLSENNTIVQYTPRPFHFLFYIKDITLNAHTLVVIPYAFVNRLQISNERNTGAIRLTAGFISPFIQIITDPNYINLTTYTVDMPMVLIREIVTDVGYRQVISFNLTINNRIEVTYPTYKSGQPAEYVRSAPRWYYLGSNIEVTLGLLHPYKVSDYDIRLLPQNIQDLSFYLRTRYDFNGAVTRRLTLLQFRPTTIAQRYSFEDATVDEIRGQCRFIKWENG